MFYSEEIIEEVRSRSPIVDVVGSYVHLTKKGGNYFGLCPFHNEKSPSFSVSPSKQMYHCFGCGKGGNVITFVMDYENYTFPEALQMLADRAGIELPKQEFTPEMKREADLRTRLLQIQKDAAYFYVATLRSEQGRIGMDYLKKRALRDETIRAFGLGYAGQHAGALYQYLKKKGYNDTEIRESGLITITERGGRDKFFNRVMYPIMDANSRVIGFGGRVMGDGEPKYLNSPETKIFDKSRNLYGLNAARRTKEKYFLICEGYMDVISMHQAGFTNAVASLGTAFTTQHGQILKRYTDEVVLCYDNDGAGRKAILRAAPILKGAGLRVKVINMEPYKDPDEFIKALGAEEFKKRIDGAVNVFLFEVACLRDEYDFSDPAEKANFFNECAKRLSEFSDEIERSSYTEAVAKKYGIDYGVLRSKVNLIGNQVGLVKKDEESYRPKQALSGKKEKENGLKEAEKLILTMLSEDALLYENVKDRLTPDDFSDELHHRTAELLFAQLKRGELNPALIISAFVSDEKYAEVSALLSSDFMADAPDAEKKQAFSEAVLRVREAGLDRQIREAADPAVLMTLLRKKQDLKREGTG